MCRQCHRNVLIIHIFPNFATKTILMQIYNLFLNKKQFQLKYFNEKWLSEPLSSDNEQEKAHLFRKNLSSWLSDDDEKAFFSVENADDCKVYCRVINDFFRHAPAAGGIVSIDENHFVAIIRNEMYDLPKGHIEKDETPENAALREVEEETGLSHLKIVEKLPDTWHCYLLNDRWTIKRTYWFLMRCDDFSPSQIKPQTEEGISQIIIIDKNEIENFKTKTFPSLKLLVDEMKK